jgi:energy-coupling factor transporter transmembrane protein EcfT
MSQFIMICVFFVRKFFDGMVILAILLIVTSRFGSYLFGKEVSISSKFYDKLIFLHEMEFPYSNRSSYCACH